MQCAWDPECKHAPTWMIDGRHICPKHLFAAWQQCRRATAEEQRELSARIPLGRHVVPWRHAQ